MFEKHAVEELASWELFLDRVAVGPESRRQLKHHHKHAKSHVHTHEHEHEHDEEDVDEDIDEDEASDQDVDTYEDEDEFEEEDDEQQADEAVSDEDDDDDDDDDDDEGDDELINVTIKHHRHHWAQKKVGAKKVPKKKKNIPKPAPSTTHGLMIDAGSQGTRIHLYEFQRRVLSGKREVLQVLDGMKLSLPTTNSRWTNRLKPGLDTVIHGQANDTELESAVREYLEPHLDFAKTVLAEKEDEWHQYPIFLKATGGLRTLPTVDRVRLVQAIRTVFHNETFSPFSFEDERARVISGEEEAIYGWAGVNFIMGTLVEQTEGTGTVLNPKKTYGMLEMGGASTQIGFFENNGDVMANLFKLQIGAARHWNVYAHSFLYFGVNGAWSRLNAQLYSNGRGTTVNPCLPAGSTAVFKSWMHLDESGTRFLPRSDPQSIPYSVDMINDKPNITECSRLTRLLLRKETNKEWVEFSHDGDCSFAGVYQPPLPIQGTEVDEFIATANYAKVWEFLQLNVRSSVQSISDGANRVCSMNTEELVAYNAQLPSPVDDDELFEYCFLSTFAFEMIHTGYEFPLDYMIMAADVLNGQKLGWALGSMLYEINILPWDFEGKLKIKAPKKKKLASAKEMDLLGMENADMEDDIFEDPNFGFYGTLVALLMVISMMVWARRRRPSTNRDGYETIPSTEI